MAESIILSIINNLLSLVEQAGTTQNNGLVIALSFLLVFGITFATTGFVPVLKDEEGINKKAIRILIAFSISFFTATNPTVTQTIEQIFPTIGIIIIGSMSFLFTIYFIFTPQTASTITKLILGPIVVITLLLTILGVAGQFKTPIITLDTEGFLFFNVALLSYTDIGFIALILIFIILIFFTKKDKKDETIFDKLMAKV